MVRPYVSATGSGPTGAGEDDGFDKRGNPRKIGQVDQRWIRVILAQDDPENVITVFERRKR